MKHSNTNTRKPLVILAATALTVLLAACALPALPPADAPISDGKSPRTLSRVFSMPSSSLTGKKAARISRFCGLPQSATTSSPVGESTRLISENAETFPTRDK